MKRAWPLEVDDPDPEIQLQRTRLALDTVIARIRPGTLFYPVLLVGYLILVHDSRVDLIASLVAIALQLGFAICRGVLYRRTTDARTRDPDRWRRIYARISAAVLFTWDAFIVFEVWQRQLDAPSMLLLTSSLVLRAAGTYATAPDLYFHEVWSRWSRIPMLVAPLVVLPLRDGFILSAAFTAHQVYAEAQCRQLNAEFWRRIVATDSLAAAHAQLRREVEIRERVEVELRLAQKLESVGRLAAGIAHEINTPLQALMSNLTFIGDGMAELIAAARDADDYAYLSTALPEAVVDAHASVSRAATIVRSMRAFSDAASKTQLDINQALAASLLVAGHECTAVADVVTEFGELPLVDGHAGELNLVFLNLVVNAAQAIEATGRRGTLRVTTRRAGEMVCITIADTGIGIPVTIKDRIFDPFFTTKAVGKGTGQGLAIAHAVVTRRHGGELSFESTAGRGTTFTIRLPISAPEARTRAAA